MATSFDAFLTAWDHHQAGRLGEAEALYRKVLDSFPNHAESLHLLGLIVYQRGQHDVAEELISRAIARKKNQPAFHSNLGEVYRAQGKLCQAEQSLRRALALDSNSADAHNNLGIVLRALGKPAEAVEAFEQAIRLREGFAEPHNNLGTVLQALGKLDEAIAHYRRAVEANPRYAAAYNNLGTALKTRAIEQYAADPSRGARPLRETLARDSASGEAFLKMGSVGIDPDFSAATEAFREALRCDPKHTGALLNLGKLLEDAGHLDLALEHYDRAVAADPQFAMAYFYRANVYKALRRHRDALAGYHDALGVQPHNPEAYSNLAVLCNHLAQPDQAVEYCRKGLEQDPKSGALYGNMATALGHQGRMSEALAASRKAVALRPESASEFSNLLYGLNRVPDYDPATLFEEHLEWARRHAEPLTALAAAHTNDPTPNRTLRVGYASPYFREHAVNFFTEPLITAHNHGEFEIFCYSDARDSDNATRRLQAAADHWRDVRSKSDKQLAELVRADAIDILVDLTGHINGSRLAVFARKPAPVQVTYIGYQNTTGMSAMDYRLTDELADPPGETDKYYTEKLVRLSGAFFCYRPADEVPDVTPLPARQSGRVTFGSFNNFNKVTPPTLRAWLEILARVPDSRLLVLASLGGHVERHIDELARKRGLDPARIELFQKRPRDEYYQLVQQADIALDPFPFNGHTTTCDAVWLGVPVVMLLGRMYAQRFGASVLANVGLGDLVARSVDEYVELAVGLAGDLDRLAELRSQLRPRMAGSVLMDFQGFARKVEAAYRQMWVAWCEQANDGGR
ncbi:MAG: tetratricopeptide repeat protein [Pirellulales bacterium]